MNENTGINQIERLTPQRVEKPARVSPEREPDTEPREGGPEIAAEIHAKATATPEGRAAHDEGVSADELIDPVDEHLKEIGQDESHPLYGRAIGKAAFERTPFGNRNLRLTAPQRKGFHRHWFIDRPGRIIGALRAGWKFVKDGDGRSTVLVTGSYQLETKEGQKSFYMEMPEKWYQEDLARSLQATAETEATIRRGEIARGDGKYVPVVPGTRTPLVQMEVERHGSANAPLVPQR